MSDARARRARLRALLGWLFALACLAWVFHDLELAELRRNVRGLRWVWVLPAIAADILSYYCQGVRWSLLLRPLGRLSPLRATRAIYAGLFTNELLPLRVGEVVRSYLVSRWMGTAIARVVPSIAVERLFDGFWLSIAFALAAIAVRLPRELARAADLVGVLVLVGVALLAVVALRPARPPKAHPRVDALPAAAGLPARWRRLAGRFVHELRGMVRAPGFLTAGLVSAGVLAGQALAFWLVMIACGLPLSIWAGAITLLIVHLGTALPNAPGNVGSYQFFCVVGLALFGIDKAAATAFSVVAFVLLTVPLWVLGFSALRTSGLTLGRVRREAGTWLRR